jgi:5-methylcytosine-specific restriction protein A
MEKPKSKQRPWGTKPALRPMQFRKSSDFYHTSQWTKESKAFREANPLCRPCQEEGIIYPAEMVDHIIPLEICKDPWDHNNWQPICRKHNNKKAAQDKKLIQKYREDHGQ